MRDILAITAELNRLKAIRTSGAEFTESDGSRVRYRSIDELNQMIGELEQELSTVAGSSAAPRRSSVRQARITSTKGIC